MAPHPTGFVDGPATPSPRGERAREARRTPPRLSVSQKNAAAWPLRFAFIVAAKKASRRASVSDADEQHPAAPPEAAAADPFDIGALGNPVIVAAYDPAGADRRGRPLDARFALGGANRFLGSRFLDRRGRAFRWPAWCPPCRRRAWPGPWPGSRRRASSAPPAPVRPDRRRSRPNSSPPTCRVLRRQPARCSGVSCASWPRIDCCDHPTRVHPQVHCVRLDTPAAHHLYRGPHAAFNRATRSTDESVRPPGGHSHRTRTGWQSQKPTPVMVLWPPPPPYPPPPPPRMTDEARLRPRRGHAAADRAAASRLRASPRAGRVRGGSRPTRASTSRGASRRPARRASTSRVRPARRFGSFAGGDAALDRPLLLQLGDEALGDGDVAGRLAALRQIALDRLLGGGVERAALASGIAAEPPQLLLGRADQVRRVRLRRDLLGQLGLRLSAGSLLICSRRATICGRTRSQVASCSNRASSSCALAPPVRSFASRASSRLHAFSCSACRSLGALLLVLALARCLALGLLPLQLLLPALGRRLLEDLEPVLGRRGRAARSRNRLMKSRSAPGIGRSPGSCPRRGDRARRARANRPGARWRQRSIDAIVMSRSGRLRAAAPGPVSLTCWARARSA